MLGVYLTHASLSSLFSVGYIIMMKALPEEVVRKSKDVEFTCAESKLVRITNKRITDNKSRKIIEESVEK